TAAGTEGQTAVTPTGETTTVAVSMVDMRYEPDALDVPAGNALVIELSNDDPHDVHDLVLANGVTSGRLQPGESTTIDAGMIGHDLAGWCSIVGHRAMGMTLQVLAAGAARSPSETGPAGASGTDDLAPVSADLQAAPG